MDLQDSCPATYTIWASSCLRTLVNMKPYIGHLCTLCDWTNLRRGFVHDCANGIPACPFRNGHFQIPDPTKTADFTIYSYLNLFFGGHLHMDSLNVQYPNSLGMRHFTQQPSCAESHTCSVMSFQQQSRVPAAHADRGKSQKWRLKTISHLCKG